MNPQKKFQYDIQHAHDHFFRESMQDIDICKELTSLTLPCQLNAELDFEMFEIVKDVFINESLKEFRSDILYRTKLKKMDQWVYLLFEHKSTPDKKTHLQLLRYMVEIWDHYKKQYGSFGLLPVVIPIIIYHGKKRFNFINSLEPLYAIIEEIREFIPDFRKCFLNLAVTKPELIEDSPDHYRGRGKLKMLLLALKYSRTSEVLRVLPQIISISEKVQNGEYDYLEVVLLYLGSVIDERLDDQFWRIIAREHSGGEKYMGTIADKLRRKERLEKERIEKELRKEIEQKEIEIEEKESVIEQKESVIEQKDTVITQKSAELESKDEQLRQIIQLMLKKGIDPRLIRKFGGLSNEKVEKIIREVK